MARKQSIADVALTLPDPIPETEGPQCLTILYPHSSKTSKAVKKGDESNTMKLLRKWNGRVPVGIREPLSLFPAWKWWRREAVVPARKGGTLACSRHGNAGSSWPRVQHVLVGWTKCCASLSGFGVFVLTMDPPALKDLPCEGHEFDDFRSTDEHGHLGGGKGVRVRASSNSS